MPAVMPAGNRLVSGWTRRWCRQLHGHWVTLKRSLKVRSESMRWHMRMWTLADYRTLWLLALAHMTLHAIISASAFASSTPRHSLWYHALTAQVLGFSEGLLVHRAVGEENHSGLCVAAGISALLGAVPLLEHVRLEPPAKPPTWAAVACMLVSVVFVTLVVILWSSFGWRRFMLFGSDPARLALFDRLLRFHTLLTLDIVFVILLLLTVVDQVLTCAHDAEAALVCHGGGGAVGGGATSIVAHALYDGLLLCAMRLERRRLVWLSIPVGIASVAWVLYASISLLEASSGVGLLLS